MLRVINHSPMLKAIVQAVFASGPMLSSSLILLLLIVVLWGIAGVQFFQG